MRRLAIVLVLVTGWRADARRAPGDAAAAQTERSDFWRDVVEPNAVEIRRIITLATTIITQANGGQYGDYDPIGEQRAKFYRDVLGMLRHARRLAPENPEVLRLLGQAADELGKTREALDAFETIVHLVGPDKAGAEVTGRLGMIYLRLGRVDDAIRFLRLAQVPAMTVTPLSAAVHVHLANALAARGQIGDAIDVLANALPASAGYYSNELALVGFALAVQYDRNDERGAALEVLDRMQSQLQSQQFANQVQAGFALMRWAPAEDQHYYEALLYEAMAQYNEARAEWALYAAAELPFRPRAQQHIAAIDAMPRLAAPAPGASHVPTKAVPARRVP
jgi:hypothetical protein